MEDAMKADPLNVGKMIETRAFELCALTGRDSFMSVRLLFFIMLYVMTDRVRTGCFFVAGKARSR
jgi:hypothetical protein